ncbi:MAG: hypothetical protein JNM41_08150 [Flavipsychrobacter sp.]|nr:hypothetical protein [Flavipsychrobacter sp.]
MKNRIVLLAALAVLIFASGCGRTIYRGKVYKSNKYVKSKQRYHFWHSHGARPRNHHGGYW